MLGSTTAPGRPGARDSAPVRVAFRSTHSVGVPEEVFSRLNTQPMRTPVNASPKPSRPDTHDSGPMWFATTFHRQGLAPSTPCRSPGARIVNLSGRGMLVVSVARQLGSGNSFARLLCCPAQAERGRKKAPWVR